MDSLKCVIPAAYKNTYVHNVHISLTNLLLYVHITLQICVLQFYEGT